MLPSFISSEFGIKEPRTFSQDTWVANSSGNTCCSLLDQTPNVMAAYRSARMLTVPANKKVWVVQVPQNRIAILHDSGGQFSEPRLVGRLHFKNMSGASHKMTVSRKFARQPLQTK